MNSKYSNRKNINYFIVKVGRPDSDIRTLFFYDALSNIVGSLDGFFRKSLFIT